MRTVKAPMSYQTVYLTIKDYNRYAVAALLYPGCTLSTGGFNNTKGDTE